MKKRKSISEITTKQQSGGCCSPQPKVENVKIEAPCCEQPADESTSCCDKNESEEVNVLKTGCC